MSTKNNLFAGKWYNKSEPKKFELCVIQKIISLTENMVWETYKRGIR